MDNPIKVPTVHLNGTSYDSLFGSYHMARNFLIDARDYLQEHAAPHARDYYMQDPEAYRQAHIQHLARVHRLDVMINDLQTILEGIDAQKPRGKTE